MFGKDSFKVNKTLYFGMSVDNYVRHNNKAKQRREKY